MPIESRRYDDETTRLLHSGCPFCGVPTDVALPGTETVKSVLRRVAVRVRPVRTEPTP